MIGFDSALNSCLLLDPIEICISLRTNCLVETKNYNMPYLAFMASKFRVTEENLLSETDLSGPSSF